MASREGKQQGFTSHGALALAKCLQTTSNIIQVWLPRHRIGPYGASALFLACRENPTIQHLNLRRCRIGERGAFAFCELLLEPGANHGLLEVDLGSNGIGHRGTVAIERALEERVKQEQKEDDVMFVNLEGNLVFPEVRDLLLKNILIQSFSRFYVAPFCFLHQIMNGVTHGLGVVLTMVGGYLLSQRVKGLSPTHHISCSIYTASLLVLYMSSTLYHSFFTLQHTKYIFQGKHGIVYSRCVWIPIDSPCFVLVFDKCAIYILIAGSYTPFLQILFGDKPIWSIGLLGFIWFCCVFGILVEAFYPTWKYRPMFSLSMYLAMGWAVLIMLPEMRERLPGGCTYYLILGGVAYTVGVPFFVRDNNLDHAIWHLFVLSGSIFHWLGIYFYVAQRPLATCTDADAY